MTVFGNSGMGDRVYGNVALLFFALVSLLSPGVPLSTLPYKLCHRQHFPLLAVGCENNTVKLALITVRDLNEITTPLIIHLLPTGSEEREYWWLGVFLLHYSPLVKTWKLLHYNCININIVG